MALGTALHRWGIPAHRLEARMNEVARRLGVEAQFFSTPTSLMAGFGPMDTQSVRLARIAPGSVDLSKLLDLDRIANAIARGALTPSEALHHIRAVDERRPLYGAPLVVVAFGLIAAGSSRFFGAGLAEIGAALGAGLLCGLLAVLVPRSPRATHVFELVAAACVTLWVAGLQYAAVSIAPFIVVLAGLIVLIPGLTLTVAASELATKNLVSGSARLTSAGMSLLQIGFGVALGQQIARHAFGPLAMFEPIPLPPSTEALALVVAAIAMTVLFQAPLSLLPPIFVVAAVAIGGGRLGAHLLTTELGAGVGALLVTLVSNGYARWRGRPAVLLLVPGLLLLVPGSLGFRSVSRMLDQDPSMGIELAFKMGLVAVAIVAGLWGATVLLPPAAESDEASASL